MRYVSTRGLSGEASFEEVLQAGYAPDGGLWVPRPQDLPVLRWQEWRDLSFTEIVMKLLPPFGVSSQLLTKESVEKAYGRFDLKEVVGFHELKKKEDSTEKTPGPVVVELFHGPSLAFKDYSLQLVGELLHNYHALHGTHSILCVSTSGDTGSAAVEAVAGKSALDLVLLYPRNRITETQRRMMTTPVASNVHLFDGVDSTSDDLDLVLKPLMKGGGELTAGSKSTIGSVNSINWARILVQMTHWFYSYFRLTEDNTQTLHIAVPTGGGGNITAGLYAQKLGLPISIHACTGPNDFVHQMIQEGRLEQASVKVSLANAMDIQIPYNMERALFILSGGNSAIIQVLYGSFEKNEGPIDLPRTLKEKVKTSLHSHKTTDEEIEATLHKVHEECGYIICPHTATAVKAALDNPDLRPMACISTASPQKFPEVYERFGIPLDKSEAVKRMMELPEQQEVLLEGTEFHPWIPVVREKVVSLIRC